MYTTNIIHKICEFFISQLLCLRLSTQMILQNWGLQEENILTTALLWVDNEIDE